MEKRKKKKELRIIYQKKRDSPSSEFTTVVRLFCCEIGSGNLGRSRAKVRDAWISAVISHKNIVAVDIFFIDWNSQLGSDECERYRTSDCLLFTVKLFQTELGKRIVVLASLSTHSHFHENTRIRVAPANRSAVELIFFVTFLEKSLIVVATLFLDEVSFFSVFSPFFSSLLLYDYKNSSLLLLLLPPHRSIVWGLMMIMWRNSVYGFSFSPSTSELSPAIVIVSSSTTVRRVRRCW